MKGTGKTSGLTTGAPGRDQSRCAGRIPEAGAMENHVFACNRATILQNLQNPQQSSFPARLPATVHEVGLAVRDYV